MNLISQFFLFVSVTIMSLNFCNTEGSDVRKLYIDLVKKCVTNTVYVDKITPEVELGRMFGVLGETPMHSMIGLKRLDNIQFCLESVIENKIEGDCIETGVWRGGATILMRAILKAYNVKDKMVYVADSFCGLPKPNFEKYPKERLHMGAANLYSHGILSVGIEEVKENFRRYGLLDNQVSFLVGWFKDTLPKAPIEKISLLRLDGDLYESTMDALVALYSKVSDGGYIIIDDYLEIESCRAAVDDFRQMHNITEPIEKIDLDGVFWKKGSQ